ncbi:hypothetical protein M405DRAFT_934502 [Rhizopogon salebrosus TDB-379]|nr:hypothetical protein M405DRAFT_934502 [Rhizopogon salebrosus TDB-379]
MDPHQYRTRPGIGMSAYSLEESPRIQSMLLPVAMKTWIIAMKRPARLVEDVE